MSPADLSIAGDKTSEIHPAHIAAVLEQLWRESSDGADALIVQVRTLNLLVFVPSALASAELNRAIDSSSIRHPGRTIAMLASQEPRAPRAQVVIACRLGSGGKQICGEQITITSGDGGAPLPSIAASLLAPGVPTYLWWHGDPPFDSALWTAFDEITDRVIVDSRSWSSPLALLPRLRDAMQHGPPGLAWADLLWTELTPWRRFVAQSFDLPDALPRLSHLRRVEIEHAANEPGRVAALLLTGWLASRLGWSYTGGGETLGFDVAGGTLDVVLLPGAVSRGLRSIALQGDGIAVQLTLDDANDCVVHRIERAGAAPLGRVTRLPRRSLEQLIDEELDMLEPDHAFEAAVDIAASIAGAA